MRKLAPFSYAQWDCSQLTTGSSYSVRLTRGLFPGVSQIPSAVSHWWLRTCMQLSEWPFRSPSLDLRLAGTVPCLVPLGCAMVVEYPWVSSKNPPLDFPSSSPFYILTVSEEFKNHVNSPWLPTLRDVLKLNLKFDVCYILCLTPCYAGLGQTLLIFGCPFPM